VADRNIAFVGSVPPNYDRYLGPVFFHHYADDLVARLTPSDGMRILETACGTGIVTERLRQRLAGRGSLVATDLNEAMIAHAEARLGPGRGAEWRQADATALPFGDREFDAVVCQFGLMFYPDKAAGIREAFRVLKPGGQYLFNVWDAMERNPIALITHRTVASFFTSDPPSFYLVPFSLHDPAPIVNWLEAAGFDDIRWERVEKQGTSPTAAEAAIGLIDGNPIGVVIRERRPEALDEIRAAVAANVAKELGDRPVRSPESAIVFSAHRPAR